MVPRVWYFSPRDATQIGRPEMVVEVFPRTFGARGGTDDAG